MLDNGKPPRIGQPRRQQKSSLVSTNVLIGTRECYGVVEAESDLSEPEMLIAMLQWAPISLATEHIWCNVSIANSLLEDQGVLLERWTV